MNFGLLIGEFNNSYTRTIVMGISEFCRQNNINLFLFMLGKTSFDLGWEHGKDPFINSIFSSRLDGLIVVGAELIITGSLDVYIKERANNPELPIVYIEEQLEESNSYLVSSCIKTGFRELIRHLVEEHHYKNFALLTGTSEIKGIKERNDIFFSELKRYGIKINKELIIISDFHFNSGGEAIRYLIDNNYLEDTDVLVTITDAMALSAWHELENNGYSVPADLAITGMGNLQTDPYYENHLTTIESYIYEKGRKSAETLYRINKGYSQEANIRIKTKAIFRDSCGCIHTPEFNISSSEYLNKLFSKLPENTINILWENIEKLKKIIKNAVYEDIKENIRKIWFTLITKAVYMNVSRSDIFSILDYFRFSF